MSDIKQREELDKITEQSVINIKYMPIYPRIFNRPIKSYSKEAGQVEGISLEMEDLNAGKIDTKTTNLLRTKGQYVVDNFFKFMMATTSKKNDYEYFDEQNMHNQIFTQFEMFNDKAFLNGNNGNKGLFRSLGDNTYIITEDYVMPTTIGEIITMFENAIKVVNKSGNGLKKVIALGSVKNLLYSETSTGSGIFNIDLVRQRFPQLEFIQTEEIEGLPDLNALLVFNADNGEVQITGNGARLSKMIEDKTGKNFVYENGSIGCRFVNSNSANLIKIADSD